MSIDYALAYTSSLTTILVPIAGWIKYKLLKRDKLLFFFFGYFILAAAVELSTSIMSLKGINNIFICNLFFLVQCIVLSLILLNWIQYEMVKKILSAILIIVLVYGTARIIFFTQPSELDNISISLEGIVLILISGFALFTVSAETEIPLLKNPKLWFCAAVFIYFSLNMAVFCTGIFLMEDRSPLRKYTWMINSVLTIISNIFYSIGILWLRPKRI